MWRRIRKLRTWQKLILGAAIVAPLSFAAGNAPPGYFEQALPAFNDWGDAVTENSVSPMPQMTGCQIAKWGQRPFLATGAAKDEHWTRDSLQALMAMGLPSDVALEAQERIRLGTPDEIVGIGNSRVHGQRQDYGQYFATTYTGKDGRRVVCHASRAAHRSNDWREPASLYHVRGYFVMVPEACGNISRVFPAYAPGVFGNPGIAPRVGYPPAVSYAPAPGALPGWPLPPEAEPPGGVVPPAIYGHVPEPSSAAISVLGLVVLGAVRLRNKPKKD